MFSKKYAALLLASTIPLMGAQCSGEASGRVECSGGQCTKSGEVKGRWEFLRTNTLAGNLLSLTETIDAAAFSIDLGQSNVSIQTQGQVTLDLVDTSTGATQASRVFNWIRSGAKVVLADPNAVNHWAAQSGGSADSLQYRMHPFITTQTSGWNTLVMADTYEGEVQAVASTQWRGWQTCTIHCP